MERAPVDHGQGIPAQAAGQPQRRVPPGRGGRQRPGGRPRPDRLRALHGSELPYRMRQKPSDDNALGLVKFIFPNPWNIYLHDTPTKHLFQRASRAYSHGCIRIGDPFDLAHALLSRQTPDPQAMFQRALSREDEVWLKLTPAVPVHLVYFTAFPDADGTIRRFEDVYGRDAPLYDAIQKAGLDS
ncbi:L,D-transpeptidase family protein [Paracoccus aerius]